MEFIESICVLDGAPRNLDYHQRRMDATRSEYFPASKRIDISDLFRKTNIPKIGKYKWRILYDKEVNFTEYHPYEIKPIGSFRIVETNPFDYRFKSADRKKFRELKENIEEDEIILTIKGKITDTSFSNLIFQNGNDWITPASYLLNGTMRQSLLDAEKIIEEEIESEDLILFSGFKLINAMLMPEESPLYPISYIRMG